jgi:hypothetical protein
MPVVWIYSSSGAGQEIEGAGDVVVKYFVNTVESLFPRMKESSGVLLDSGSIPE